MINQIANRVASVFVTYGESSEENTDIYAYAIEAIIAFLTNLIICVVISLLFGRIVEGIIFMLSFAFLRRITGGYHAKSHKICIFIFSCIVSVVMILLTFLSGYEVANYIALGTSFAALIGITMMPIIIKKMKAAEIINYKSINKSGVFTVIGIWSICVLSIFLFENHIGLSISLSMFAVFGGTMAQGTKSNRKEVTEND